MRHHYPHNDLLEAAYDALGAFATLCAYVGVAVLIAAGLYVCLVIGACR